MSPRVPLAATVAVLATAAALAAPAGAATNQQVADAVDAGAGWIDAQQNATTGAFNPGFSSFDPTPTALAPAGRNAADVTNGSSPSLQDAIFAAVSDPGNADHPADVGPYENAILSSYAAGIDPARISASESLVADLASTYTDGYFGDPTTPFAGFNNVAFGVLALNRVDAPRFLLDRTVAVIRANQHNDGGWDFSQSVTPDTQDDASSVDLTGATLAALCDSGVPASDSAVEAGVGFLRSRYVPSSGAIVGPGQFDSANASSTGWAVSGLKACGIDPQGPGFSGAQTPIDYLLSLQDDSGTATDGSFLYSDPPPFFAPGPDLPSSRDALRALAGRSFTSEPPARALSTQPRTRAVPAVAGGTSVPVALAVDNGAGGVTFCRVTVPNGASLATLLASANGSSSPGGCATGGEFTGGQVSKLNGQTGTWAYSVDGGQEQIAAGQAVRFGEFVALRRTSGAVPAVLNAGTGDGTGTDSPAAAVPAAQQAKTTPTGVVSKSLNASAKRRVVTVSLTCAKDNRLCQGTVYLVYKKRTLSRRAFLIGGGKTTRLNVKLSKGAMKKLGKRKKRIRVNVFSRDGAGIASTSTRAVTLTPTR